MENNHSSENGQSDDRSEKQKARIKPIWTVSYTAIAVWAFVGLAGLLWWWVSAKVSTISTAQVFIESAFSLAVVIVIVVHAIMYYKQASTASKQFNVMREQGEIFRKQLEMTDRPWLSVDVAFRAPLTFTDTHVNLHFRFVATNVGRSVAVNAVFNAEVLVPRVGSENFDLRTFILTKQAEVCTNIPSGFIGPAIVFPGKNFLFNYGSGLSRADVESAKIGDFGGLFIYLVGCIDYQISGHERHHQTRFIYEIERKVYDEHRRDWVVDAVRFGTDVPTGDLIVKPSFTIPGDYAD